MPATAIVKTTALAFQNLALESAFQGVSALQVTPETATPKANASRNARHKNVHKAGAGARKLADVNLLRRHQNHKVS